MPLMSINGAIRNTMPFNFCKTAFIAAMSISVVLKKHAQKSI